MIVVRDIFRIKFGRMKEARATLAEGIPALKKEGYAVERLLADFVGPFYTLVMEGSYRKPRRLRESAGKGARFCKMGEVYEKFAALVDSGSHEIFTLIS